MVNLAEKGGNYKMKRNLERVMGFEPTAPCLGSKESTTEQDGTLYNTNPF